MRGNDRENLGVQTDSVVKIRAAVEEGKAVRFAQIDGRWQTGHFYFLAVDRMGRYWVGGRIIAEGDREGGRWGAILIDECRNAQAVDEPIKSFSLAEGVGAAGNHPMLCLISTAPVFEARPTTADR